MAAAAADLVEQLGISETLLSMETIKPSSPTPPDLRTHTLSWIDQAMVPTHIGVVLFYLQGGGDDDGIAGAPSDTTSERLCLLKQSLSHALSLYYVLAGRIGSGGASGAVNCTDEGIDFIDARVGCPLSAVLRTTTKNPAESGTVVDLFLPCGRLCTKGGAGGPLLIVKATTFSCGGMALGLCLHHTVADGQSLAFFLKTWASIARGVPDVEVGMPALEAAAAAFPLLGTLPSYPPAAGRPRMVRKRFVLDGSKICALREQSTNRALTRVEAVTALLWRSLIRSYSSAAAAAGVGGAAPAAAEFVACHDVGLRARMRPPLPETSFGNLFMWVAAFVPRHPVDLPLTDDVVTADRSSSSSSSTTLRRLTEEQISAAIRGMDDAYIRDTLQSPEGPSAFDSRLGERLSQAAPVTWFSSWWSFPFYEADFGWGKPAWVACGGLDDVPTETQVVLMGRREAGGHMEAWVWSEETAKLDKDPELLSLLSSDPLPHIP